jgi:hypothetical protein
MPGPMVALDKVSKRFVRPLDLDTPTPVAA